MESDDCMLPFAGKVRGNGGLLASRKWLPFLVE